jgi:protein-glutamine gamma-glutamyltransferase
MSTVRTPNAEGLHLLALKAAIYAGAVLVFVGPLATPCGTVSALATIPLALLLSRWLARSRLRLPVLLAAGVGLAVLGLKVHDWLGGQSWFAGWLGYRDTMAWLEGLTFGLTTLGILFALRTMTLRRPVLALVEAGLVAAVVVWSFAGHRDAQMGQPRALADWALSRGHDPLLLILGAGLLTLGGLALLLLRGQKLVQTAGTLVVLVLVCLGAGLCLQTGPATPPEIDDAKAGGGGSGGGKGPPRLVAIVLLKDDYEPVEKVFYFRQQAFSRFNGKRLVAVEGLGTDQDGTGRRTGVYLPFVLLRKTVTTQVAELIEQTRPLVLANGVSVEVRDNPNPKLFSQAYEVSSQVLVSPYYALSFAKLGNHSWSPEQRKLYLELPNDPRYAKLAEEIVGEMRPHDRQQPFKKILATRRWLEKNVIYSKRPSPTGDQDPTTAFLFGDRRGYCVHIAHAMAFLLRAQGIPARVAGGFAVDPTSRKGSTLGVWDFMGHEWCEIYVEGLGWVVMDVAVERSEEEPNPIPDPTMLMQLGELARRKVPPQATTEEAMDLGSLGWMAALAGGISLLTSLYLVKLWRRLAPRLVRTRNLYRVAYRAVLDRLAELGHVRRFGETREEFAQRLAPLVPAFVDLSAAHVRHAVGGIDTGNRSEWRDLTTRVHADLAGKFSRGRRLLGLLHPLAWWRTR